MAAEKQGLSRRRFLKVSALGGAGLALGVYLAAGGEPVKGPVEVWPEAAGGLKPNTWLMVGGDETVTVRVNHTEMGQDVATALAMIVAEELEADWARVRFEIAPAESVYKNPEFGAQLTAGSTSVRTTFEPLRRAGAQARQMLVAAAARAWGVPEADCRAQKGRVVHAAGGRSLSYGQLAPEAAKLPPPDKVSLKDPASFSLIGRDLPRLDAEAKATGRAVFGLDVSLPGLLTATVVHPPAFGQKLKRFDPAEALAQPGVLRVLEIDSGLAVVARTFWQASQAADKLKIEWDEAGRIDCDSEALPRRWAGLAASAEAKKLYGLGDPEEAAKRARRSLRGAYELPYQAHATPEPMNCTAHVRAGRCLVWAPTQHQDAAQEAAARICGLGYDRVEVHTTYVGGGFGRRIQVDYVAEAVQLSQALGAPVKVVWSREEDTRHGFYRPASYNLLEAHLDEAGRPLAWRHLIVGPDDKAQTIPRLVSSMVPYWVPRGPRNLAGRLSRSLAPRFAAGSGAGEGAAPLPYSIPNVRLDYIKDDPGVPVGFWRSVAHSQNAFVVESFLDEIAAAAGRDPLDLRLDLLGQNPRLKRVVELAARQAGWGEKPPRGRHRGLAAHDFHDTLVGCVAEVSVSPKGEVKVPRVVCAVDCGLAVNPRGVRTQIQGGIIFGLTATLKSAISVRRGRVRESNFHDFPLLRMDEAPLVEVHLVPSVSPPTGIGEAGVPVIAPAVCNAVFAATGRRIRRIPIDPRELTRA